MLKVARLEIDWHRHLPIFASGRYLRLLGNEYGWLGGVDDGGEVACVLPFVIIEKPLLRLVRFPVETILLKPGLDSEQERDFLTAAVEQFRSMNVDVIVPGTFNTLFRTFPDGATAASYANVVVDLSRAEEALWNGVHHKHRNVIRSAIRKGVTIEAGIEHVETAYRLTLASFLRSASGPVSRWRVTARLRLPEFRRLVQGLGGQVLVLVAKCNGIAQSAAVIPFSDHSAYYMHGGTLDHPVAGASNLLQWEAMRMCRSMGVARYNFFGVRVSPDSGSKAAGIRNFKQRFGGNVVEGYMWKMALRPVKYAMYELAALIRNGGDVVAQERIRRAAPSVPSVPDILPAQSAETRQER